MAGGIFGGMLPATPGTQAGAVQAYQPQYSPSDWLSLLGAGVKQFSNGGDDLAQAQQTIAGRAVTMQRLQAQQALMGALGGGQGAGQQQAGGMGGAPSVGSALPALLRAQAMGLDITPYVNLLDKAQPNIQVANGVAYDTHAATPGSRIGVNLSNVNNRLVDTQNPANANLTVPQVEPGQTVSYDARGIPTGVSDLPGNNTTVAARTRLMQAGAAQTSAATGASRNAYDQSTGGKPKPWDRKW